jgi:protein gp37
MGTGWLEALRDQCRAAGVPLFLKQIGSVWAQEHLARHSKGGDPDEWPAALRIREWPEDQR